MSASANPLSEGDIAASNVLPTFETSLRFGVTEQQLADTLGWTRERLMQPNATVSGASTYQHMELMFAHGAFAEFVIAAARAHDAASLGIVGLACKTMPDVGAAMACHARFQRLTNRSATYETSVEVDGLHFRERRDSSTHGAVLISEYTMLVTVRLLSLLLGKPAPLKEMCVRRSLSAHERECFEREVGAPVHDGASTAELILDASITSLPVARADAELERYFREVLERALPATIDEAPLINSVRSVLRERIRGGHPTLDEVARVLAVSGRTLQRRLGEHGFTFQQLLDDTLKAAADGYLRQRQLTLAEVTWLLGYVEQASFFRAFKRWHGVTPDAFRQRINAR